MALLGDLVAEHRSIIEDMMFEDVCIKQVRTMTRGSGVGQVETFADGTTFNGNLQDIVRRPDAGEIGHGIAVVGDHMLMYPKSVVLNQADRVKVNGEVFTIRIVFDTDESAFTNHAWVTKAVKAG